MYELAAVVEGLLGAAAALEYYLGLRHGAEVVVYNDNQFVVDAAQPGYHSIASLRAAGLDHIVPLAIEAWAAAGELAGRGAVVRVLRLAPRPHPYGGVAHGSSDFTVAVMNIYVLCIYAFMNYEVMQ